MPAFPLTDPVMSDEKTSLPVNVLLSLNKVEEAAVVGAPVIWLYGSERLGSVVMPEIEEEAERRLSKRLLKVVV